MAEGEDHIRFEMTTAAAEEEQLPPLLSRKDKREISSRSKQSTGSSQATTPAKEPKKIGLSDYQAKKIKVRVELESSQPKKEESSSSTSPITSPKSPNPSQGELTGFVHLYCTALVIYSLFCTRILILCTYSVMYRVSQKTSVLKNGHNSYLNAAIKTIKTIFENS